jgi:predicted nucleic acid-binding protein
VTAADRRSSTPAAGRSATPVVLDASVGVKWFRDESGSGEARALLAEHGRGEITIVVPSLFVYEFVAVATRTLSTEQTTRLWEHFLTWRVHVRTVGDRLVQDAIEMKKRLECTLYDAVAPALARSLRAPLYSADRRAHGRGEGVVFVD